MKISLIVFFCIVLAIYGSEDLFVFELNPALNGGHTARDILKIYPANGLKPFTCLLIFTMLANGIEWQFSPSNIKHLLKIERQYRNGKIVLTENS